MKLAYPSTKELSRLYWELSKLGAPSVGKKYPWPYHPQSTEELLALACDLSRYDPRLLSILVSWLYKNWKKFFPQVLRDFYPKMDCPQTVALVAEFLKNLPQEKELSYCMTYLQEGLAPVPFQLYFRGLYQPGGKMSQRAVLESLAEYRRWGFLAREMPSLDVFKKTTLGHLSQEARLFYLKELLKEKKTIQLSDYLKALPVKVSRQQALQDLKKVSRLKKNSVGRAAEWVEVFT
ncbi:MAG: hypothetical protein KDK66_02265 [Deltaproteobacteria bacterium]|nr:hypothetical protein [Deltaproteobacteria bacterium]